MKQSTLHDINSGMPVVIAVVILALLGWSFSALLMEQPTYYVAWVKPCATCEAVPHAVYKSKREAESKAPKGAVILPLDR